jgi:hypothetical protein
MKIKVFVYSYKNKGLLSFCENLQKNAFNEVIIDVCDQNAIDRSELFYKKNNINYKHIKWDDRQGIYKHRSKSLFGNFDYFLSISDSTIFNLGWDNELIKECEDSNIVSGKDLIFLKLDKFFILSEKKISDKVSQSQWINDDFIFLKMSNTKFFPKLNFLKKCGDDLLLSILFTQLGFKIKSMNSSFYDKINKDEKYMPYSKYHGYNELLLSIQNKTINAEKFEKYHNLDLSLLKPLPFDTDDVLYDTISYKIDTLDETRFHTKLKKIEIG